MYAYYLDRGHTIESLLSLSIMEKIFHIEAMNFMLEKEQEKYNKMFGEIK